MQNLQPEIRNTVRAVIIRQKQILLLKKDGGGNGVRYTLPGGAQETGETLQRAVIRECLEEIACAVETGDILYVADYFKYKSVPEPHTRHQLEILFQCCVPESYIPRNGPKPDKHQVAVEWIELRDLVRLTISPRVVSELLCNIGQNGQAVYAGPID